MKNILEIIKKAPKDHVYYCTVFGYCNCSGSDDDEYPIKCDILSDADRGAMSLLTKDGKFFENTPDSECVLFPSRDNRDWEAFERELDGDVSGKSFSDNTFDGTAEMVSIPDRPMPMMAAVIMSGMLAGGCKDKGAALVNKAVHLADLILDETETKTKEE